VQLRMLVRDEQGRPAADARLGVRVWNEAAVELSGEEPVLLADAVRNISAETVQQAAQQNLAQQMLPQLAQKPASPAANDAGQRDASHRDAGQQSAGQTAAGLASAAPPPTEPIHLASNRASVEAAARQAIAQAIDQRRQVSRTVAWLLVAGGLLILGLAAAELVLRTARSAKLLVPAGAIAAASLVVGLLWTLNPRSAPERPLAMARSAVPARRAAQSAGEQQRARAPTEKKPTKTEPSSAGRSAGIGGLGGGAAGQLHRSPEPLWDQPAAVPPASALTPSRQSASAPTGTASRENASAGNASVAKDSAGNQPADKDALDQLAARGRRKLAASPAKAEESSSLAAAPPPAMPASPAALPAASPAAAAAPPAAPAALYFNPQLLTDKEGRATIEFTMPKTPAEYRLLIDALGQGRIGSQQMTIVCGQAGK